MKLILLCSLICGLGLGFGSVSFGSTFGDPDRGITQYDLGLESYYVSEVSYCLNRIDACNRIMPHLDYLIANEQFVEAMNELLYEGIHAGADHRTIPNVVRQLVAACLDVAFPHRATRTAWRGEKFETAEEAIEACAEDWLFLRRNPIEAEVILRETERRAQEEITVCQDRINRYSRSLNRLRELNGGMLAYENFL